MSGPCGPITAFSESYRFLSNFWPCVVRMYGLPYPSTEHAFQAAKTLDLAQREAIRLAASPGQAKRLGRTVTLRENWDSLRLVAMRILLERKFSDPKLRAALLATAPRELVEGNTWGDRYWGVCGGVGQNHLGRLLMDIRDSTMTEEVSDELS